MVTESFETRAEDGDFKFIFKTFGREFSAEEAQFLCAATTAPQFSIADAQQALPLTDILSAI